MVLISPIFLTTTSAFSCNCDILCEEINTCDEAYFQLNECGCTDRDSDKNGIPCEDICELKPSQAKSEPQKHDYFGTTFETYIQNLLDDNVVNGYPDGTYRPNEPVSRLAMAKFIVKAFDFQVDTAGEKFPDVSDMTNELQTYVQTLKNLGIVKGFSDGTYHPNDPVTRESVTKYIAKVLEKKGVAVDYTLENKFSDVNFDNKFIGEIAYLNSIDYNGDKVIKGMSDGTYHPTDSLTRGAMAKIIDNSRKAMSSLPKGESIFFTQQSIIPIRCEMCKDFDITAQIPSNAIINPSYDEISADEYGTSTITNNLFTLSTTVYEGGGRLSW